MIPDHKTYVQHHAQSLELILTSLVIKKIFFKLFNSSIHFSHIQFLVLSFQSHSISGLVLVLTWDPDLQQQTHNSGFDFLNPTFSKTGLCDVRKDLGKVCLTHSTWSAVM